jgi:hypothetical protein
MNKLIMSSIGFLILSISGAAKASMSYECWAYVEGNPSKMVNVTADSTSEARKLAKNKMDKLKIKYSYVKCK